MSIPSSPVFSIGVAAEGGGGGTSIPEWGAGKHLVEWRTYQGVLAGARWVEHGGSVDHPTAPTLAGLTFDAWCGFASNVTEDRTIIGVWVPTDGKLHIHVVADAINGLTPTLKFAKTDTSTMTVEWGDGTTSTSSASGNVTIVKATPYVAGAYEIKASITSGAGFYNLGHGSTNNSLLAGVMVQETWLPAIQMLATIPAWAFSSTSFRTQEYITGIRNATGVGISSFVDNRALNYVAMPLVTSVGNSGMANCHGICKVVAPSLTAAGNNAFENDYCLDELYAPTFDFAGTACFQNCHALPKLPNDGALLTSVGSSACKFGYGIRYANLAVLAAIPATMFDACRTLREVVIGPNCTSIGLNAFVGNYDLRILTLQGLTPPSLASVASLSGHSELLVIRVPIAALATYQAATNWSSFAGRMVGY